MSLPAGAIDRLSQRRLQPRWARSAVGSGERTSGEAGSGIEFVEHRAYQPGDDLRHLDRHAYARFRAPIVKRYAADRGLDVTLLVDRSASMAFGSPSKEAVAVDIATGLACAALAGGDRLRVGTFAGGGEITFSRPVTGVRRLDEAVAALAEPGAQGVTDLARVARSTLATARGPGVLVLVSDWWTEDPGAVARALGGTGQELVAVHVLSPDEEEPPEAADGTVRLEDAETGAVLDVHVDPATRAAYRHELERWRGSLRAAVADVRGRYLPVRTDRDLEDVLLREWHVEGFVA